ncbi:LysR family transcriptional regulator, partial [Desulfosarcina sp. OttesenSCG-928-A07]|nr:LysR family transcriptional regulator [Desulfosarcina sp. OttesenSCG-928-G17]MDL2330317.1 LysR family transcriptional regulator [Desulfosarcina sp. OttesenSCG-928-A07]
SKAAEILDIGLSTLSRRIKLLEKRMGVPLFYRTTRTVELTTAGSMLLERCEFVLAEAGNAYASVVNHMQKPAGLIRVYTYADTYANSIFFNGVFSSFVARWPEINLNVIFAEKSVDLFTAPYDVAFLIEPLSNPDLVARKIFTIDPFLYASPALFERYPMPVVPEDLHQLPCITLERFGNVWALKKGRKEVTLTIRPKFTFSSVGLCHEFALSGHGVALLRSALADSSKASGELIRVLPEWQGPEHALYMVTGPGQLPWRVRLFTDHIMAHFGVKTVSGTSNSHY